MTYTFPNECCSGFSKMDFSKLARWEYHTRALSKLARSSQVACCLLAASIFGLGVYRDMRFTIAMDTQPHWGFLHQNWALWTGYICLFGGTVLVVSSFLALGFYGTFLGDYFGILMEKRVTSFPFNIIENPMYWGSSLNFVGCALIKGSQAGLFLTFVIAVMYKIALFFEGPFTAKIYAEHKRGNRKLLNKQA